MERRDEPWIGDQGISSRCFAGVARQTALSSLFLKVRKHGFCLVASDFAAFCTFSKKGR